ncbi:MAG TPA: DUF3187 family protein [Geobacteraceae bacterium]
MSRCHLTRRFVRPPLALAGLVLAVLLLASPARCVEITPFYTQNQSPLVQIFGLPAAGSAFVLSKGEKEGVVALDIANSFVEKANTHEMLLLDGESYRTTFAFRFGLAKGVEGGIDIPFTGQGGGIFDNFIIGWHDFFGLPQGGREDAPHNRLRYDYARDGRTLLAVNDSGFGLGDVRLSGGVQLYRAEGERSRGVALRASLKLPTGDSNNLHGSGSTDTALWLTASDDYKLSIGHAALFVSGGGLYMTPGNILRGQQRPFVAFGSLGCGWSPTEWIGFKVEFSGHTPFYQDSDLRSLGSSAGQLLMGGTLGFTPRTSLDIGVSEDVVVDTSPDIALHLALRHKF